MLKKTYGMIRRALSHINLVWMLLLYIGASLMEAFSPSVGKRNNKPRQSAQVNWK